MKRWRRDLLLAAALLIAALALALIMRPGDSGGEVLVLLDGEEVGRYALSEERTVRIGEEDYNVLVIRDGGAAVRSANCGDLTCVRTGEIRRAGEQIICLPHRLVIRVTGGGGPELDAAAR